MKSLLTAIYSIIIALGIEPKKMKKSIRGIRHYIKDYYALKKQKGRNTEFPFGRNYPILHDRFDESGRMTGHYFHQDLYVAKKVFDKNPKKHLDIGSRTDGFVGHVAVFRKIEIIDIRDQSSKVKNIIFKKADLMNEPPSEMLETYDSISSLHAIEHFGLGRYGDPIDYFGYKKAIKNISKLLEKGGVFYFSVPIGNQRIEFNAHRVFSLKYLIPLLQEFYTIKNFSYVNDKGDFFEEIELTESQINNSLECRFGCGIFELIKK